MKILTMLIRKYPRPTHGFGNGGFIEGLDAILSRHLQCVSNSWLQSLENFDFILGNRKKVNGRSNLECKEDG